MLDGMLQGAPDRRMYRRFAAASRAEAEAQARAFTYQAATYGFSPAADRWDEQRRVLEVAYVAPGASSGRARGRPPMGTAAVALVAVVGLAVLIGLGTLRPTPLGTSPAAQSTPAMGQTPSPAASDYAGPLPAFVPGECRTEWLFGRESDCGDLIVLEDRADPDGRRVILHVAIHRSYSRRAKPDPVVYLEGGPGGAPLVDGFLAYPFLDDRDLIVFDQRGTGLARPSLRCSEVTSLFTSDELAALRRCHDRLLAQGVALDAYNSAHSAADLADLRTALGYEEWNLYGVSYGTRLALTALRDHPTGLRSLVLDSVYPPHVDIYGEMSTNAQRAFDALFEGCRADEQCASTYPWLEQRFYDLVERLDRQPIEVGGGLLGVGAITVDGKLLLDYLFNSMYVTDFLADLPAELEGFTDGDWSLLDWYWASYSPDLTLNSEGYYYTVQCAEELPFSDPAQVALQPPGVRVSVSQAFDWRDMLDACGLWDVPPADSRENLPVVSDVPVMLLAGTYDPITPPSWAEAAAAHLSASQLVLVPGVGHGVVGTSYCIDDIVTQFLGDPFRRVDDGCLTRLRAPEFKVPQ